MAALPHGRQIADKGRDLDEAAALDPRYWIRHAEGGTGSIVMAHPPPRSALLADDRGRSADQRELEDHIRALRRYAYALVGRSANADDLVQETLKRAIGHLREGKEIHNLRSYLLTVLHNARNDYLAQERRLGKTLPLDEGVELSIPASQLGHIQCREVAEIIDTLPEDQREVLLLVGLEGTTYQDATKILHIPIGTVMSRLNRGRNAIRGRLGMEATTPAKQRSKGAFSQRNTDRTTETRSAQGRMRGADGRVTQTLGDRPASSTSASRQINAKG